MSKQFPHRRWPDDDVLWADDEPGETDAIGTLDLREQLARTLPMMRPPRRWPAATAWPTPAPAPGRVVGGRYVLGREIGEGACGTVYEAMEIASEERVAVKVASGMFAASSEGMARFRREAIAASSIGHDGIVDVIDSGRDPDGVQYIVMEYLEGVDLARVIEDEGPLPLARALEIAVHVADALAAAHRAGVVHRDLKPANIYLQRADEDDADVVKVIDFGVSKMRELGPEALELTSPGRILGSPCYMAPEQARGEAVIDGRADVYALGIILYEMLTRRPPFDGDSAMQVIEQQLVADPVPPSEVTQARVPKSVDALVARALAKDPADRFQSMEELRDALSDVLQRERDRDRCRVLGVIGSLAAAFVGALVASR